VPESVMPPYPWLAETTLDYEHIDDHLRAWRDIDRADLYHDMQAARDIPGMLTRLGHGVRREVVIGVTGHRPNRLGTASALEGAVKQTLHEIAAAYPDAEFVVLSLLAEGADRLVARLAMDCLSARLRVALPLPYDVYVEDFGAEPELARDASVAEFHELLGQAERYFEMPLEFGSIVELSAGAADVCRLRAKQYALAGAYVVQRSHELIAIWDGEESEGEGGTADVISWRRYGVPDEYRFPDRFFPSVELTAPFVVPVAPGPDFRPARYGGSVSPVPRR